jgi:hypothetical protein
MLMSNETEALKIIETWNIKAQNSPNENVRNQRITHVAVFTVFDSNGNDLNYGDETKWVWFVRIARQMGMPIQEESAYANTTTLGQGSVQWYDLGKTTIIYKMMTYAKHLRVSSVEAPTLEHFRLAYMSNMNRSDLWNIGGLNAVVGIYEVIY